MPLTVTNSTLQVVTLPLFSVSPYLLAATVSWSLCFPGILWGSFKGPCKHILLAVVWCWPFSSCPGLVYFGEVCGLPPEKKHHEGASLLPWLLVPATKGASVEGPVSLCSQSHQCFCSLHFLSRVTLLSGSTYHPSRYKLPILCQTPFIKP